MEEGRFLACRKKAMALLLHNDRTKWELCDKLKRAGFEEDAVEDAVAYVESYHYLDDFRYAVRFAEIYCESRSIQRIRQDLKKRHVPEEYIEDALGQIDYDDSRALAKEIHKLTKGRELSEEFPKARYLFLRGRDAYFSKPRRISGRIPEKDFRLRRRFRSRRNRKNV